MTGAVQQTGPQPAGSTSAVAEPDSRPPVRGAIHIGQDVVAKVAAQAASELPDVGGASHGMGRLPGGSAPDLGRRPKVTAHVDGTQAYLDLVVSVRWPASVSQATSALRGHLHERVRELTGFQVRAVNIEVADLVIHTASGARVQ